MANGEQGRHGCRLARGKTQSGGSPVHGRQTFLQHIVIVPMSMVTGTLPLPGGGLGAFEFVMNYYYRNVAGVDGQGLLVALAYRAATVAVAVVGIVYYVVSRKDVSRVIHDAEEEMGTEG